MAQTASEDASFKAKQKLTIVLKQEARSLWNFFIMILLTFTMRLPDVLCMFTTITCFENVIDWPIIADFQISKHCILA